MFVVYFEMGITGIGLANVCTQLIIFVLLVSYTNMQTDIQEAIFYPDSRTYNDLKTYFSLAIPSTMMLCLDWWVWELMVLISGYLGVDEQAATIVVMNVVSLAYMFIMGFKVSSCTLIGQQIGKGDV